MTVEINSGVAPFVVVGNTAGDGPTKQERYVACVIALRAKWGLTDWRFKFTEDQPGNDEYAVVSFAWDARLAYFTAFTTDEKCDVTPEDAARHEVLHVMFYDLTKIIETRANCMHPDALREEHKVIERLLPLLV